MKKFAKLSSVLGVTLLEIMLVLAIAAMIIVMSIRYYQAATSSQQANVVVQKIAAIIAAADSMSLSTGSYAGVTTNSIGGLLSNSGGLVTPWGTDITVVGGTTSYKVTIPDTPPSVCGILWGQLKGDQRVGSDLTECTSATSPTNFVFTYNLLPQTKSP